MRKDLFSFRLLPPGLARPASTSDSLSPCFIASAGGPRFHVGMLAHFVRFFRCARRQDDAHRCELKAERTVQQVLNPAAIPDLPGFSIRTIYKPARTSGGFRTCFVILVEADATLAVANAGQCASYLRGAAFAVEGGPTLELAAESTCNEGTPRLSHHKQLTVVTDGVVEARDAKGEAPGFERMTAPAVNAAVEDAGAAQRRGRRTGLLCPR